MTHAFYRALIVTAALTAVAAAVLALFESWNWALALLSLAVAQLPTLLHLQTRRMVRVSSTVGSRVSRGVNATLPAAVPSADQDLARMQEILNRLETSVPAAPAQGPSGGASSPSSAADQDVQVTVNEFRRELRMTRLVLSELLQAQNGAASPVAEAAGKPLR